RIQAEVDAEDEKASRLKASQGPVQAGQRNYPSHFPAQHVQKPGHEADLKPTPLYEVPNYKGSDKLLDKVAIITGGDPGIGRSIAVLYAREDADVAIIYLNEHQDPMATKAAVEREGCRCVAIPGDVSDAAFCKAAVHKTLAEFGKIDIL